MLDVQHIRNSWIEEELIEHTNEKQDHYTERDRSTCSPNSMVSGSHHKHLQNSTIKPELPGITQWGDEERTPQKHKEAIEKLSSIHQSYCEKNPEKRSPRYSELPTKEYEGTEFLLLLIAPLNPSVRKFVRKYY